MTDSKKRYHNFVLSNFVPISLGLITALFAFIYNAENILLYHNRNKIDNLFKYKLTKTIITTIANTSVVNVFNRDATLAKLRNN